MPRQPKCFVCRLRPPDDGKELCGICVGHVQTFVQGRLEHLGFLVRLYCGWSKCRTEFYSPRWRDPAYHTATCKQMAYYERKKAGTTAAKPALARRLRPVRDSRRVSAPSPQMCELCGRYPPYQKGGPALPTVSCDDRALHPKPLGRPGPRGHGHLRTGAVSV